MAAYPSVMTDRRARLASSPLRHLDLVLVGSVLAINALGLLMIYSATRNGLGGNTGPTYYLQRQIVFVVLGIGIMAGAILIDYRRMREWAPAIYVVTIVMLALVMTPLGSSTLGSQARFSLGPIAIQPSEFAKFAIIDRKSTRLNSSHIPLSRMPSSA